MELEKWQWAWLAGLYEGEGSISFTNQNSAQVKIIMTDEDVIRTVDSLVPSPRGVRTCEFPHKKTQYCWVLSSSGVVADFLKAVLPYLHARRKARATEAIARLANNRGQRDERTHCPRGHPLEGEHLYVNKTTGARSCLTCRRAYDLRRNARQKEERRLKRERSML